MQVLQKLIDPGHRLSDAGIQKQIQLAVEQFKKAPAKVSKEKSNAILVSGGDEADRLSAAYLIATQTGQEIYRVDLASIVSKYIGETEKNLSAVFDKADRNNWILFFDEADALFGKRTGVRDSHDRYANTEVAYLLQRIESHGGVTILASNLKSNVDSAFIRRLRAIIDL